MDVAIGPIKPVYPPSTEFDVDFEDLEAMLLATWDTVAFL